MGLRLVWLAADANRAGGLEAWWPSGSVGEQSVYVAFQKESSAVGRG